MREGGGTTRDGRRLPRLGLVPRLLRTSAFRYTVLYVFLFAASFVGIGLYVYEATIGETMDRLDEELTAELYYLAEVNRAAGTDGYKGLSDVRAEIQRLKIVKQGARYMVVFAGPPVRVLETDFLAAPPEMLSADGMFEFTYTARSVDPEGRIVNVERPAVGRTAEFVYGRPGGGVVRVIILAARDVRDIVRLREDARVLLLRVAVGAVALGLILGAIYSSAFLRRVDGISRTVQAITGGDLTRRVTLTGSGDEFDKLSGNVNAMLDQIERLMMGMRQVSDNIAHDLRSPLTRIKARLETAITDPGTDRDEVLDRTATDVERLLATFNALLSITRLEAGESGGHSVPVDVAGVAEELAELYEPAAEEAGFMLTTDVRPVPPVLGSRELISQLIANLLDNALKYARHDAKGCEVKPRIDLSVAPRPGGGVLLTVMDNGPGVSEADQERILRRFVRLERSRSTSGNGLGLSLVAAIAKRHDAQLTIGRGLPHRERSRALVPPADYGLGVRVAFPPAPNASSKNASPKAG